MAEWLGQQIADLPGWLIAICVIVFGIIYLCYILIFPGPGSELLERFFDRRRRERQLQKKSKRVTEGKQ